MTRARLVVAVAVFVTSSAAETADEIMTKVAENQDRAKELRSAFVYQQSVLIRFHRGGGKLAREELSEYTVAPTPDGTRETRTHFLGKYRDDGTLNEYYQPHYTYKDVDLDGEIISDLAEELTSDKQSRDGISADLFPLTSKEGRRYRFELAGREKYQGHDVYRILFRPSRDWTEDNGSPWKGEALIDVEQYQPVLVTTDLAKGIPLWVRTVLGTNIRHLGFKVAYEEFDDGVWFPVQYGGEFDLRAVFFYKRRISISLRNSGFERADVSSTVKYGEVIAEER